MFNSFPGNSTTSGQDLTIAGGGNLYPVLRPLSGYKGAPNSVAGSFDTRLNRFVQGYIGDNDFIELPASATGIMNYYDNTGTQIVAGAWAAGIAPSEVNAGANSWIGFMLDTSGLMYVVVTDAGRTTYWLASINSSGTITAIGAGASPATAFTAPPGWNAPISNGSSCIWREKDGTGNIFIRAYNSSLLLSEELEIDISTGAVVGDTTVIGTGQLHYKTAQGVYAGFFQGVNPGSTSAANNVQLWVSKGENYYLSVPTLSSGVPASASGAIPLQWDGNIVMAGTSQLPINQKAFSVSAFENYINSLSILGGL